MMVKKGCLLLLLITCLIVWSGEGLADNWAEGIYISQGTLQNTNYLNYLIANSKAVGIDTFIIDFNQLTKKYQQNIHLVEANHINYVARIVVFPHGGTHEIITSPAYWSLKNSLIKQAIDLGAQQIQLDYIRYNTSQGASSEKAKYVLSSH